MSFGSCPVRRREEHINGRVAVLFGICRSESPFCHPFGRRLLFQDVLEAARLDVGDHIASGDIVACGEFSGFGEWRSFFTEDRVFCLVTRIHFTSVRSDMCSRHAEPIGGCDASVGLASYFSGVALSPTGDQSKSWRRVTFVPMRRPISHAPNHRTKDKDEDDV
jgi:hypothetical protein